MMSSPSAAGPSSANAGGDGGAGDDGSHGGGDTTTNDQGGTKNGTSKPKLSTTTQLQQKALRKGMERLMEEQVALSDIRKMLMNTRQDLNREIAVVLKLQKIAKNAYLFQHGMPYEDDASFTKTTEPGPSSSAAGAASSSNEAGMDQSFMDNILKDFMADIDEEGTLSQELVDIKDILVDDTM